MAKITVKVIGTKNNKNFPDDTAIINYFVAQGAMQAYYEELSWLYQENSPDYVVGRLSDFLGRRCVAHFLPKEYREQMKCVHDADVACWSFLDTKRTTVTVIAQCDQEDEGVVAVWFRKELVKESGYADEDITVLFSDMGNPGDSVDAIAGLLSSIPTAKAAGNALDSYLREYLDVNFIFEHSASLDSDHSTAVSAKFFFMGKRFKIDACNDDGNLCLYVTLDEPDHCYKTSIGKPGKIMDEMLARFFDYSERIKKIFDPLDAGISLEKVDIPEKRMVYKARLEQLPGATFDVAFTVATETDACKAEVSANGNSFGTTGRHTIEDSKAEAFRRDVHEIIQGACHELFKEEIGRILKNRAEFDEGTPTKDHKTVVFSGKYNGCPARFSVKPELLKTGTVGVSIIGKDGLTTDAVITPDSGEDPWNIIDNAVILLEQDSADTGEPLSKFGFASKIITGIFGNTVILDDTYAEYEQKTGHITCRGTYLDIPTVFHVYDNGARDVRVEIGGAGKEAFVTDVIDSQEELSRLNHKISNAQHRKRPSKDYSADIRCVLKNNVNRLEEPPAWIPEKNQLVYTGEYCRCPAKFTVTPDVPYTANVKIFGPDGRQLCDVDVSVPRDEHTVDNLLTLNRAVDACRNWKRPLDPENPVDRLAALEDKLSGFLDEVKALKASITRG